MFLLKGIVISGAASGGARGAIAPPKHIFQKLQ